MARIPTSIDAGAVLPTASRPIASYDVSAIGQGVADLGRAIGGVGDQMIEQDRVVGISQAEAYKTDQFLALDRTLKADPNYQTFPTTAQPMAKQIVEKAAGFIRDPRIRERWMADKARDVAILHQDAITLAETKQRTAAVTALNDSLKQMGTIYSDPNTPPDVMASTMRNIGGSIDMAEKTGLITPDVASKARQAYIVSSKEQYLENLAKSGGQLPDLGIAKPMAAINGQATAYGPGFGGQEGGPNDAKGAPVATLDDYAAGRVKEITLAGNPQFAGKRYTIPSITFTGPDGETKTLKNVPAVVTDTGGAFNTAPEGRFDIPVAKNMAPADLARQPFSGQIISFVPEYERPKSKINAASADLGNLSPSAKSLLDGIAAKGVLPEIKITSGFRDADRNAAARGAKASQHIHGNALDIDLTGLSNEQKAELLQAAIASGARGIGIYPSDNAMHVDTRETPAFWGPNKAGAYAGAEVGEFPGWAQPHLQALKEGKTPPPEQFKGPRVDPHFADVPFEKRLAAQQTSDAFAKQRAAEAVASQRVMQTQTKESYQLAIQIDDPSVTQQRILSDARLDAGDKAGLLKDLETREKRDAGVAEFLARMAKGELVAAPFDTEGNKFADGAYEKLKKAAPAEAHQPIAEEIAKAHGSAPKDYVQAIMGDIASIDHPDKVLAGLQRAQRLMGVSKTALGRGEYQRVESAAVMFRHFVEDLGMTPDEAARKYMAVTDPAKRKSVDEPTAEKEAKRLTVGDVTNAFDGILIWEPSAGNTHAQSAAMLGDYRELFKMEYMQTGDADAAKAKALDHFKKSYGITRLSGSNVLMKHPPENYYPPIDDSHDWMQKQVVEAAKQATGKDYDPAKVFVVTTTATDADVRAKRAPSYEVWVEDKDANGYADFKPITGRGRFVFDPMAALNKPEALAKRQAEMARREKAKQDLDNAGWWWEFATRALAP